MTYIDLIKSNTVSLGWGKASETSTKSAMAKSTEDLIKEWFDVKEELKILTEDTAKFSHENIPVFDFKPLNKIRQELIKAGHSRQNVESIISGLSELPKYANQNDTKSTGRK